MNTGAAQELATALRHHQAGQLSEAERIYRRVLSTEPSNTEALHLLGVLASQVNRNDVAAQLISDAIRIGPDCAMYESNLGNALAAQAQWEPAAAAFRKAIELDPFYAAAHNNLGNALAALGDTSAAIAAYRQAIQRQPAFAQAYNNLGLALASQGNLDEAIVVYSDAAAFPSPSPELENNLANALRERGDVGAALQHYHKALALAPTFAEAHSNLLFAQHYRPEDLQPQSLYIAHREWERRHAATCAVAGDFPNPREPDRPLRIGYFSPDMRDHAVARFLLPLLEHHDRNHFTIHAYAQVQRSDSITSALQQHCSVWRNVVGLSDDQLTAAIRQDSIDILVDLAGHTASNRLLVFARKSAPIQITWLGYPDTTGLAAIDYRFTDALADVPGLAEPFYSEQLLRLPDTAWCFQPHPGTPPVSPPPCKTSGYITFGSFAALPKISDAVLTLWVRILQQLPTAHLLLKNSAAQSEVATARLRRFLQDYGVQPTRLTLLPRTATAAEHLSHYRQIDICLDTFPYHGTTTTLEALYMGLPVVTLAGTAHASRVGVSLLTGAGLPHLIAPSPGQYVDTAVQLAHRPDLLAELRCSLRDRLRASVLMDARRFAANVESAYRVVWQAWCHNHT